MITKGWVALWLFMLGFPILMVCVKHIAIDWYEEAWLRKSMFRSILPWLIVSVLFILAALILLLI